LPAIVFAGGAARLAVTPDPGLVADVRLRIVQARIDQKLKWREEERAANLEAHVALSRGAGWDGITHLIWPETATAYFLANDDRARARVSEAVAPGGLLIVGAVRMERVPGQGIRAWNALHAIDEHGAILATYDKHHLVPFGEFVPLRRVLPIEKITPGAVDFTPGPSLVTLRVPGLPPLSPLICYEAIFPGHVARADDRPAFLLNLTNDAWFGESAGPHQHFAAARMRAVEEGLPLVRAANTGISAVIDGHGRVVAKLDLGARGVLDAALPKALAVPTPFARWGNWVLLPLLGIAFLVARRLDRP
jgi:apolipoprotein N-acyltransferase